jgi:hypothetical protein
MEKNSKFLRNTVNEGKRLEKAQILTHLRIAVAEVGRIDPRHANCSALVQAVVPAVGVTRHTATADNNCMLGVYWQGHWISNQHYFFNPVLRNRNRRDRNFLQKRNLNRNLITDLKGTGTVINYGFPKT